MLGRAWFYLLFRIVIGWTLVGILFLGKANAATLLGIITERAAPSAIEAAHRHLAQHPGDRIQLRTPAQFMAASDKQVGQWLDDADSVLAVSVFGEPARRLKAALARHVRPQVPVLAMNGEASLSLMSRNASGSLQRPQSVAASRPASLQDRGTPDGSMLGSGGIDRRFYELCALSELKNALRSGDVWVPGSRQFKDFEECI